MMEDYLDEAKRNIKRAEMTDSSEYENLYIQTATALALIAIAELLQPIAAAAELQGRTLAGVGVTPEGFS